MNILIIKLGAKGDVVRTLCILPALKEKFPNSDIYWITKPENLSLFENNPYIKQMLPFSKSNLNFDSKKILTSSDFRGAQKPEVFDILINLDVEDKATELAEKIKSKKKLGFYKTEDFPAAFNLGSEYYLNTLYDDELKKTNKRTYQQMIFDSAELEWKNQKSELFLSSKEKQYAERFISKNNLNTKKLIGIHMGASSRWPSKVWHESRLVEFIKLAKSKGYEILLFAGPNEVEEHKKIVEKLRKEPITVYQNNPNNSDREFISLVDICSSMVCSDSFALHISIALNKPTVGLFFCTSPDEVESYELLRKVVSPMLKDVFPEKCDLYNEELTKSISAETVLSFINKKK